MTRSEKVIVEGLLSAMALTAPAFLFHSAPRFPGSLPGSVLGIAAALLFVALLTYTLVKRQGRVKALVTGRVSLGQVLTFHVYAGAIGAVLGVLHSGHKLENPLGIGLMVSMLLVVASGFVGRYFLVELGQDLRDQQRQLSVLRDRYDSLALAAAGLKDELVVDPSGLRMDHLLGAISDLEFAIGARDTLKRSLNGWVVIHILAAIVMYTLLSLHIWSGVYYGLRWLP
ncbi:hypothetical protein [Phenylobacterium ferrooxidans]|uniref:Iron reductase n=1 Tax=Phenylobacterium ferrooxidans TaxID=2982689 RepID=A0ABW6CP13_9CAUL